MKKRIEVTRDSLAAAFADWEQQVRDYSGPIPLRTREEIAAMPVQTVAGECADFLWKLLDAPHDR